MGCRACNVSFCNLHVCLLPISYWFHVSPRENGQPELFWLWKIKKQTNKKRKYLLSCLSLKIQHCPLADNNGVDFNMMQAGHMQKLCESDREVPTIAQDSEQQFL